MTDRIHLTVRQKRFGEAGMANHTVCRILKSCMESMTGERKQANCSIMEKILPKGMGFIGFYAYFCHTGRRFV